MPRLQCRPTLDNQFRGFLHRRNFPFTTIMILKMSKEYKLSFIVLAEELCLARRLWRGVKCGHVFRGRELHKEFPGIVCVCY